MNRPVPRASIIVRCRDKGDTIEAALRSLRAQTVPVEIVVVDSGSTDDTVEIAERYADRIVRIRPEDFTYGRSLNLGAEHATAEIHGALSAHVVAPTRTWVEDSLRYYADPRVAGTGGRLGGVRSHEVCFPTLEQVQREPGWIFSNTASTWRASVRGLHPFREDLPACEDLEWLWWGLGHGWRFAFDPVLAMHTGHRRREGLPAQWCRHHREARALTLLGRPPHRDAGEALAEWWSSFPYDSRWPRAIRRLSPYRMAECGGSYTGTRSAQRELATRRSG